MRFTAGCLPSLHSAVRTTVPSMASPLDAVATPLTKFQGSGVSNSNPLADAPFEVLALFAVILLVGVGGLVRSSGVLSSAAPTVGLGESREELKEEAQQAATEEAGMTQAEKEAMYFKEIRSELAAKRGGSGKKRKKARKK